MQMSASELKRMQANASEYSSMAIANPFLFSTTDTRRPEKPDLVSPPGYSTSNQIANESVQQSDNTLLAKRSWEIALGPFKQLPMNLFITWMAGNSISIFPIMMVGMLLVRPIKALFSMGTSE